MGLLLLVLLATAPFYCGRSALYLLVEIFSYLALASLWNLLAGYSGLVSIGQQAFVGLGGYSLFTLTMFGGLPPILAVALAGAISVLLAVVGAALVVYLVDEKDRQEFADAIHEAKPHMIECKVPEGT